MIVEPDSVPWLLPTWVVVGFLCGTVARTLAAAAQPVALAAPPPLPLHRCPVCHRSLLRAEVLFPPLGQRERSNPGASEKATCGGCSTSTRAFPFAEIGGAAIFAALALRFGTLHLDLVVASASAVVLLTLFVTDVSYRLIPNRILYPAALALLAVQIVRHGPRPPLLGIVVCGGFFLGIYLFGILMSATLFRGQLAFGLGDVKLAGFVGVLVGWPAALSAITYTVVVGAGLALIWIVRGRVRESLPYGTALAFGAVLTLVLDPRVW